MENLRIEIKKSQRRLQIFDGEKLIKQYKIALGFAPDGDKLVEGDGKTPVGEFYIAAKNDCSKFYLSLGLSYPNREAAKRGWREKIISNEEHDAIIEAHKLKKMPAQNTALGGEIYIHGGGIETDWTRGCIALNDEEMREVYEIISHGTKVLIVE